MQISLAPDAEHLEGIEDRRHDHCPAANPEQPGYQPAHQPGRRQGQQQQEQVGEGECGHGRGLSVIRTRIGEPASGENRRVPVRGPARDPSRPKLGQASVPF